MKNKKFEPAWVKSAVFYQIYPQTFFDSNGDGIGDLPGVIEKLGYIESLGVNAIWLAPCFLSPFRDAGYDVTDYCKVAPRYGTNGDLKKLLREAKKRGIRVLLDLVAGHTSIDHPWFKASCSPETNEFTNRYIWTDSALAKADGSFVKGFCERDGSFLTNFFWSQPALNFGYAKPEKPWQLPTTHPDVQATWKAMHAVIHFWLDAGADGFRVDMAGSLIRNDPGAKEIKRFWRETREMLDRDYPEAFMVAEWGCPADALDGGFHADFFHWFSGYYALFREEHYRSGSRTKYPGASFFDAGGKGNIIKFLEPYLDQYRKTRNKGYIAVPVGNHDISRINIRRSPKDLEIIMAFLMTFPGTPFIYYGDEIGMRHLPDTPNREGGYHPRIGARTPMQWTADLNAGFSKGRTTDLYLPVDASKNAPNVAAQETRKNSLLNSTRRLIALRRAEPALSADAKFEVLYAEKNKYPFIFRRSKGREKIVVAFNPSRLSVSVPLATGAARLLAGSGAELAGGQCRLSGRSYGIWKLN